MKHRKTVLIGSLLLFLGTASFVWYANYSISHAAAEKTFDEADRVPYTKVGLLLGTSKTLKNGRINLYFKYRIEAATNLFKAGKISCLIISGDNSTKQYDEPTDMKWELIKNGIDSTKIHLDYAGFRTFDSIVRAKEIFGQNEIVVISQKFHNERSLFIADKLGIRAYGFNAKDVDKRYGFKTALREKLARVKVFLDFLFGTEPKFLGEKIVVC